MSKQDKDDRRDEKLVVAEPGTEQYTKTGDARAVDHAHGGSYFDPRSADEENLAEGPKSPTDPNYLEALRKTDGGQEQVDELVAGTDGDSTYGPAGDVTAVHKDDGDHYDHTGKDVREGDAKDRKDGKAASHTDRNVDVKVQPSHGARDAK